MKRTTFALLVLFVLLFSCNKKDDTTEDSKSNLPQITGFECRNEEGNSLGSYGEEVNNNIGNRNPNNGEVKYVLPFPNPAEDYIMLYSENIDTTLYRKCWIVQAIFNGELPEELKPDDYNSQPYTGDEILIEFETLSTFFRANLSDIPNGFYRLYYEVGDEQYYENLIVNHQFWGY